MTFTPRFEHDDDTQPFVGRMDQYDVYYGEKFDEVILRFGSNGPDYRAMELSDVVNLDTTSDYGKALTLITNHIKQVAWESNQESLNR